jgi:hypothetical protein
LSSFNVKAVNNKGKLGNLLDVVASGKNKGSDGGCSES